MRNTIYRSIAICVSGDPVIYSIKTSIHSFPSRLPWLIETQGSKNQSTVDFDYPQLRSSNCQCIFFTHAEPSEKFGIFLNSQIQRKLNSSCIRPIKILEIIGQFTVLGVPRWSEGLFLSTLCLRVFLFTFLCKYLSKSTTLDKYFSCHTSYGSGYEHL